MKMINIIKRKKLLFFAIGMFLLISCISISYASLNTELMITGEAIIRVDADIRVTDIKMLKVENDSYETFNSKYTKDSTNMYMTLPNPNSTITYQVTIKNKSNHAYIISAITDELINSNIIYRVDNYKEVQIVPKNSTVAMNITFYYSSDVQADDITQIATLNYKFERPYASHLEFDHTNVDTTCTNVQCALDELYERF